MVVTQDADLDLAVEGALFSGFGTAGQRCTSLGTVIVHESVHGEFLARFAAARPQARLGDPTQDVLYGPDAGPAVRRALRGVPGLDRPARRTRRDRPDHRGQPARRTSSATRRRGCSTTR